MRVTKAAVLGALLLPMTTVPASAQSWKADWNINAGYSHYSSMLKSEDTGLSDNDVKFKNGGLLGSQLTFWFGPKLGLRFNGTYADRPLTANNATTFPTGASNGLGHVNLWSGSADLMFRLASPASEFTHMEVLPYIALGGGAKWINPSGDNFACGDSSTSCAPFSVNGAAFGLKDGASIMGLGGLGADWRFSRNIAIRTEIGDRVYKPKIVALNSLTFTGTAPGIVTVTNSDENVSKLVNELYAQVGLGFLFGVARPAAVALAPAPMAPPPPPPAPAPTVSREPLSVCVVDPTATNGLRMQSAYLVGGRDTVIVANGADQPFNSSIGYVPTASTADWYVRGQPLTINVGTTKMEYATYGSTRVVNSEDLAYLGTVNGIPVYADRNDVSGFINDWNTANSTVSSRDLGMTLNGQKTLRTNFEKVKVLYVPMASSGCVFQAVQRQEDVRKSGK